MPGHIEIAKAQLATCSIAHEEVASTLHTLDQLHGQGFSRLIVLGKALKPLPLIEPILHQLTRELNEVTDNIRPAKRGVASSGKHPV